MNSRNKTAVGPSSGVAAEAAAMPSAIAAGTAAMQSVSAAATALIRGNGSGRDCRRDISNALQSQKTITVLLFTTVDSVGFLFKELCHLERLQAGATASAVPSAAAAATTSDVKCDHGDSAKGRCAAQLRLICADGGTLVTCRASVFDAGPTRNQRFASVWLSGDPVSTDNNPIWAAHCSGPIPGMFWTL